jgi:hypothetical protein
MSVSSRGVVVSALVLSLRCAHLLVLALGLTIGALSLISGLLTVMTRPGPLLLALDLGICVVIVALWAALIGWLMGAVCWRARRDMSAQPPNMAGRGRAALLGAGFGLASLLVLPLPFVVHELWLAIPLTMIEGRALPDALGRARALAARHRRALLIDQARLALCGLLPFGLAALATYGSTFMYRGDWAGLAIAVFGIMAFSVAAGLAWCWLLVSVGALYVRYGVSPELDAEALAEVFA